LNHSQSKVIYLKLVFNT